MPKRLVVDDLAQIRKLIRDLLGYHASGVVSYTYMRVQVLLQNADVQ